MISVSQVLFMAASGVVVVGLCFAEVQNAWDEGVASGTRAALSPESVPSEQENEDPEPLPAESEMENEEELEQAQGKQLSGLSESPVLVGLLEAGVEKLIEDAGKAREESLLARQKAEQLAERVQALEAEKLAAEKAAREASEEAAQQAADNEAKAKKEKEAQERAKEQVVRTVNSVPQRCNYVYTCNTHRGQSRRCSSRMVRVSCSCSCSRR